MSTRRIPLPLKQLIERNLSIVVQFAYSRAALEKLRGQFEGEWKNLDIVIFEQAEVSATRAIVELALYLRAMDDEQTVSHSYGPLITDGFGHTITRKGKKEPLNLRNVANKIIHGKDYHWEFPARASPAFVMEARDNKEDWTRAEVPVARLVWFVGTLVPG